MSGGQDSGGNYLNDIWYSDDDGGTWQQVVNGGGSAVNIHHTATGAAVRGRGRARHAMGVHGGSLYIIFGRYGAGHMESNLRSADGVSWDYLPNEFGTVTDTEFISLAGNFYMAGGKYANGSASKDVYEWGGSSFGFDDGALFLLGTNVGAPGAAVLNGLAHVVGGGNRLYTWSEGAGDTGEIDVSGSIGSPQYAEMVNYGGHPVVIGGEVNGIGSAAVWFSSDGMSWTRAADFPAAVSRHVAISYSRPAP